ncbi:MAG: hypothetical protein Q8O55_07460 [Dehalococcoidales bacterium]|nr:hypothetical protein [Dehalococcoidales bacterium]
MTTQKHSHNFQLRKEEFGISKGSCGCGAVKYFVDDPGDTEVMERALLLNRKHGKEGNVMVQASSDKATENTTETKGVPVVNSELTKDQKKAIAEDAVKRGIKLVASEHSLDWQVVRGWTLTYTDRKVNLEMFDKDKEAIIHDYQTVKLKDLFKKWHFYSSTWLKLKERWKVKGKRPAQSVLNTEKKARKTAGVRTQSKTIPPVVNSELTEEEMAAICIKCEHIESHNGKMHCAYEVCPLGYTLKAEKGVSTTELPLSIAKETVRETKVPQNIPENMPRLIPLGTFTVEVAPSLPALPEFDPLWPSDVKMKWLDVFGKMATGGKNEKIDALVELLKSQEGAEPDWDKVVPIKGHAAHGDQAVTLLEQDMMFVFDPTGEHFLGVVNFKE